jgi:hypothetical protein
MLRWQILSIIPVFLVLVGCSKKVEGPKIAEVKGKVTRDGAPLASGKIVFDAGPGVPATELDIQDGVYSGQVLVGSKTVRISSYKTVPQKGPMKDQTMLENTLPAKYNTDSKETREVKEGVPNEFDFAVTSK